jgi:hypothetical protein
VTWVDARISAGYYATNTIIKTKTVGQKAFVLARLRKYANMCVQRYEAIVEILIVIVWGIQ